MIGSLALGGLESRVVIDNAPEQGFVLLSWGGGGGPSMRLGLSSYILGITLPRPFTMATQCWTGYGLIASTISLPQWDELGWWA